MFNTSTKAFVVVTVLAFFALAANADDAPPTSSPASPGSSSSPPPAAKSSAKPVYLTVGDVVGEVIEVDSSTIKIRVTWMTTVPTGNPHINTNWARGTRIRTARQLYEHQLHMREAMARALSHMHVRTGHHDYTFPFTPDAQARLKLLPPKTDESGKKIAYTPEEKRALKGNPDIPGWKASLTELKVGQAVEVHVVQPKITEKDQKAELMARWALILNDPDEKKEDLKNK